METTGREEPHHQVERYSCSRCKFHTTSKRQLQHHIKQRHSPGKYVCQECGEKFNRALMYKLHVTTHTSNNEHACPTCNKTFPLVSMLKIHQDTHSAESIHPCPHCSKQFRQKSALSKHVAFGHTKKNVHPCTACGKIFPSPSTLMLHMDSHKSSTDKKASAEGGPTGRRLRFYRRPNDQNMFKCQRCQRKFFTSYALAKHMEGHHGMQSYKCIQCNLDFKTKKALYRHTAEHVHECDECGKKYRSQEQLESHKKFHNKGHELACTLCGRHFSKGASYRRHMEAHAHNPKYQCPECGKSFRRQADLNTHQWLHKGDGFPCEDCGKAFGTKQHLIWHSYIHYTAKSVVKSEGDVKVERSESEVTADEGTESELKKEPVGISETEANTPSGTPKKSIKKEKPRSTTKKDNQEEKEKENKKEKKRTPSPAKKCAAGSAAKQCTPPESPKKKGNETGKAVKVEKEIKIKEEQIEESKAKGASTAKGAKTPKKSHKRRSKGRRKSKKPNTTNSDEPTATDTDSRAVTETESERDTQSERQPGEKMMSTEEEEVLLSDDVLHNSNELHDAKELRVETVMFDDIEDDVELDIDAAIETLTKLGSHTEHEVTPEAFDEVVIDEEELDQQTVKDLPGEEDIVGLGDISGMDTEDKAISHVDIQSLYDMETDNDTGAETEDAVKAAAVFCELQTDARTTSGHLDPDADPDGEHVISESSAAALLIEDEIATQADRLIQTGLYVQNVMGAQDCNTVLEALNSAVQNQTLNVDQDLMEAENVVGDKTESGSVNLTQNILEDVAAASNVELEGVEVETEIVPACDQTEQLVSLTTSDTNAPQCDKPGTSPETALSEALGVSSEKGKSTEQNEEGSETETVKCQGPNPADTNIVEESKSASVEPQVIEVTEAKENSEPNCESQKEEVITQLDQNESPLTSKEGTDTGVDNSEKLPATNPDTDMDTNEVSTKCISGTYIANVEMINQSLDGDRVNTECGHSITEGMDLQDKVVESCPHIEMTGHRLDSSEQCVSGCNKCSNQSGLSINRTVCPHSKELKVLLEKLDLKGCQVGDNGEVVVSVAKGADPAPAQKRKRTASSDIGSLPGSKETSPSVTSERSPNKTVVGMSRLRRRIRHSSGSKSVSTKCCETRRKESQPHTEAVLCGEEGGENNASRVTTRSGNARVARSLRTGHQVVKDWRKSPPSAEKKHGRKFTSVPRRRSDSDQMSPPPQYKVSTLTDLTIRITTQSSPETSPPQLKKSSPSSRDVKSPRVVDKEYGSLRQTYGATQELCVVLDDINELVLLQQERLRKLKNCKPVKLGRKLEEPKKRHKSSDISPEISTQPKPIKLFLRLPKERIKKHERRLLSYSSTNEAEVSEGREYQQPDSSQDMQRDRGRVCKGSVNGCDGRKASGRRAEDAVSRERAAEGAGNTGAQSETAWQEARSSSQHRVIGSVVSLNSSSVLSVEECDSTSTAETQRQATTRSATCSPSTEAARRGVRRKESSPNKATESVVSEPLDLTVKYKELSDSDVKPDPDEACDSGEGEEEEEDAKEVDADFCTCDEEKPLVGKLPHSPHSGQAARAPSSGAVRVKEDPEDGGVAASGSALSDHNSGSDDSDDHRGHPLSFSPDELHSEGQESGAVQGEAAADGEEEGTVTEYIEVIDRGIQCELGDELLFMPDVPQQAVD